MKLPYFNNLVNKKPGFDLLYYRVHSPHACATANAVSLVVSQPFLPDITVFQLAGLKT